MYIAVTIVAAMLLGAGFVLQQNAAEKLPATSFLRPRLLAALLRQPRWLAGLVTMVTGQLLSAWTLGHLALTVTEPLLTTSLVFALLLAIPISGEVPRRAEIFGALLLTAGVAALSVSRSVRSPTESFGSSSHWPAAAVIAAVAALLAYAGRRNVARMRATLTGAGSGLLLGIADALTRRSVEVIDAHGLTALLVTWSGYVLIITAVTGLWLMESAFTAGPLRTSLPAITAGEPLAGMALGVIVFGDVIHISPWLLALQAAGVAALVLGVILVAKAPAFGKLRIAHIPVAGALRHPPGPTAPGRARSEEPNPAQAAPSQPNPAQAVPASAVPASAVPASAVPASADPAIPASADPASADPASADPAVASPSPVHDALTTRTSNPTLRGSPATIPAGPAGTGRRAHAWRFDIGNRSTG
jgi:drug/metabolite transporter (DMT)-like permease